jgi:hypothetical protein
VASGVESFVNSSGQLGTVLSSERFKEAIRPMDKVSEAILSLQPVTFRYKPDLDPAKHGTDALILLTSKTNVVGTSTFNSANWGL